RACRRPGRRHRCRAGPCVRGDQRYRVRGEMNAVIAGRGDRTHAAGTARRIAHGNSDLPTARVALLGTGNVGEAVLARLAGWSGTRMGEVLTLAHVGNSRTALQDEGLCPAFAQACFAGSIGVIGTGAARGAAGRGSVELDGLPRVL